MGLAAHIARRAGRGSQRRRPPTGRDDGVGEVGRPVRPRPGRRLLGLRRPHHRRRAEASLPRPHLVGARATQREGAPPRRPARHRRARPLARAGTHRGRAGRAPRPRRDDIVAGLAAGAAQTPGTLDTGNGDDEAPGDRNAALASHEDGFELAEHREVIGGLLDSSPSASAGSSSCGSSRSCRSRRSPRHGYLADARLTPAPPVVRADAVLAGRLARRHGLKPCVTRSLLDAAPSGYSPICRESRSAHSPQEVHTHVRIHRMTQSRPPSPGSTPPAEHG
jgi:hypothetical protein